MTKTIAILIISLSLPIIITAQELRMGLVANPQVSWLNSNSAKVKNNGAVFGYNFGLTTDLFFAERYSFSTGATINNIGGKLLYSDTILFKTNDGTDTFPGLTSVKYKLQYIDIPLTFKMESNQIGYLVYFAKFGVINHLRIGATSTVSQLKIDGVACKDEVAFYNLSYLVGAGINYYISKNTAITFGITYNSSFVDLTKNKTVNDKTTLNNIALNIGVIF